MLNSTGLRVVVADDEEINLFILIKNMSDNGYLPKGFDGGIAVWDYLQKNPYNVDIVILDKMMSDLNGVEVIKLMKKHPVLRHVPILMQSGCIDIKEGLEAGADCYLVKPFSAEKMIAAIEELTRMDVKKLLIKA